MKSNEKCEASDIVGVYMCCKMYKCSVHLSLNQNIKWDCKVAAGKLPDFIHQVHV